MLHCCEIRIFTVNFPYDNCSLFWYIPAYSLSLPPSHVFTGVVVGKYRKTLSVQIAGGRQEQAHLRVTFWNCSNKNVVRDVQLPDGHIATHPPLLFSLTAHKVRLIRTIARPFSGKASNVQCTNTCAPCVRVHIHTQTVSNKRCGNTLSPTSLVNSWRHSLSCVTALFSLLIMCPEDWMGSVWDMTHPCA